jgi:hypothetical protein
VIQTRFQVKSEFIPKNAKISKTFSMLKSLKSSSVDSKLKFLKRSQSAVGSIITKKRKKRPNVPENSQKGKTGLLYNIEYYLYKFTLKVSALFTKAKVLAKEFTMPKIFLAILH